MFKVHVDLIDNMLHSSFMLINDTTNYIVV